MRFLSTRRRRRAAVDSRVVVPLLATIVFQSMLAASPARATTPAQAAAGALLAAVGSSDEAGEPGLDADGLALPDPTHPCLTEVTPDALDDVLLAADCPNFQRVNPFFGFTGVGPKIAVFLALLLLAFFLTIAMFRARVNGGGSSVSVFVVSIVIVLVTALLAAFVSFSEYTWTTDWCQCAPIPEGRVVELAIGQALKRVQPVWWLIGLGFVAVLIVVTKVSVPKPRASGEEV